jgi:hypothetical protein
MFSFLFFDLLQSGIFDLISLIPSFVSLVTRRHDIGADVAFAPFSVKLFLNQLYYSLLLSLNTSLLFAETVELCLSIRNLLTKTIGIVNSSIGISIPNIENRYEDVSAEVVKGFRTVSGQLPLIILILFVIQRMGGTLKYIKVLIPTLRTSCTFGKFIILKNSLVRIVYLLLTIIKPIAH